MRIVQLFVLLHAIVVEMARFSLWTGWKLAWEFSGQLGLGHLEVGLCCFHKWHMVSQALQNWTLLRKEPWLDQVFFFRVSGCQCSRTWSQKIWTILLKEFFLVLHTWVKGICVSSLKDSKEFSSPLNFVNDKFGVYDRVPQDTVLNPGKLQTLKWIPG